MTTPEDTWTWDLTPNHWIDLTLTETGLSYMGTDWDCQSGGGYMAGFQTIREFLDQGPLKEMPSDIAAAIRAVVEARPVGHRVVVRIGGEQPDEIHCTFQSQSQIKFDTDVLFDGELVDGSYTTSGIAVYPGADAKGRRRMMLFEQTFEVTAPAEITIGELRPRFED